MDEGDTGFVSVWVKLSNGWELGFGEGFWDAKGSEMLREDIWLADRWYWCFESFRDYCENKNLMKMILNML